MLYKTKYPAQSGVQCSLCLLQKQNHSPRGLLTFQQDSCFLEWDICSLPCMGNKVHIYLMHSPDYSFFHIFLHQRLIIDIVSLSKTQILLLGRSQSSSVTLGKFLNFSEAEIPFWYNRKTISLTYPWLYPWLDYHEN